MHHLNVERALELGAAGAFTLLAVAALRLWWRMRTEPSARLASAFGVLGAVVLLGQVVDDDRPNRVLRVAVVMGLLLFPYLLFRFASWFRKPGRLMGWVAVGLTVAVVVGAPLLPADPSDQGPFVTLYTVIALGYWTFLSVWVAFGLWRSGRGQPTVARRRMRLLGLAAAVLNVALFATAGGTGRPVLVIASQVIGIASALLFLLAFAPPGVVRREWRRVEARSLLAAERDLMAATDVPTVARALVPRIAALLGGTTVLVSDDGELLAAHPERSPRALMLVDRLGEVSRTEPGVSLRRGMLVVELQRARMAVEANAYTPFFGSEEAEVLASLAPSADLALERAALHERERRARQEAEAANRELEALLYGISHDLRSPLVALTGYTDLLAESLAEAADDQPAFLIERLRSNTRYMDALIRDLLEVARIGRVEEHREVVALQSVVSEIADDVVRTSKGVTMHVGPLPSVFMDPVRCRQLFTNVLHNAVRHSGRSDTVVRVESRVGDDGSLEISLWDNGVGIPPEYSEQVFGVFQRLSERTESSGTGVGLAVCRKIVEHVGGRMWIAEAEVGADVRIWLPSSVVAAEPDRALPA